MSDYLDPEELCPGDRAKGESVKLAVHALMLNPNAYWARLDLIEWLFGDNALEYDGYVLDNFKSSEPELYECANKATITFFAVKLSQYIYAYERRSRPLKVFAEGIYKFAKKQTRQYYTDNIGIGRSDLISASPKTPGSAADAVSAAIDAEYEEIFGDADVFEIIGELFERAGSKYARLTVAPQTRQTQSVTQWKEMAIKYADELDNRNEILETFYEDTRSAPGAEYLSVLNSADDGKNEVTWSITTTKNEQQKNSMSRYQNEAYGRKVGVVRSVQEGGEINADDETGREIKSGWQNKQLKYLKFDMSAKELERALDALTKHNTPQYSERSAAGSKYAAATLPPFEEFKAYVIANRQFNTPKRRVDAEVIAEVLRLYFWEGVTGYGDILKRIGSDFSIKIAREKCEKPTAAKILKVATVRGKVVKNRHLLDDFMNSRQNCIKEL